MTFGQRDRDAAPRPVDREPLWGEYERAIGSTRAATFVVLAQTTAMLAAIVLSIARGTLTPIYWAIVYSFCSALAVGFIALLRHGASRLTSKRKRQRPPLHLLNAIVKALWSAKTYERVFKPVIADIHHEWADARRRHEKFRAWWIRNVRGRYAVLDVARHQLPWSAWSAIKRLVQLMFTFSK